MTVSYGRKPTGHEVAKEMASHSPQQPRRSLDEIIREQDAKLERASQQINAIYEQKKSSILKRWRLAAFVVIGASLSWLYIFEPIVSDAINKASNVNRTLANAAETIAPDLEKPMKGGDKVGRFTMGTRDFGDHLHPIHRTWRFHNGMDIGAGGGLPENSQLFVVGTGQKTKVTCLIQPSGAGLYAILEPDNMPNRSFMAAHLNKCSFKIGESGYMKPGQVFGLVGGDPSKGDIAGTSTGPHLHWSEKQDGKWVNPTFWPLFQVMHGHLPQPALKSPAQKLLQHQREPLMQFNVGPQQTK